MAITLEFTVFTIIIQIARTIAFDVTPTGGTAALTRLMCANRTILAIAFLHAILSVTSLRTTLFTPLTLVARRAYTRAIHRRTTRRIRTLTIQFTTRAILQERTWPITLCAAPAILAITLARHRMTVMRVKRITITCLITIVAVLVERANTFAAIIAFPAGRTLAGACRFVAIAIILTFAFLRTVQAVSVERTLIVTELTQIAGRAFTLSANVMTWSTFETFALLLTLCTVETNRTFICADVACPTGRTQASATSRVTRSVILTATVLFALHAMFTIRA